MPISPSWPGPFSQAYQLSQQTQPPQTGAKGQQDKWPKWPQALGGMADLPNWAAVGPTRKGLVNGCQLQGAHQPEEGCWPG